MIKTTMHTPDSSDLNSMVRTVGQTKISQLLKCWPKGTVAVQSWLNSKTIFRQLTARYVQGKWLTKISKGAYIQFGDIVDWTGGIFSLQNQLNFKVHVAGLTALDLLGYGYLIPTAEGNRIWFSKHRLDKRPIPLWFREYFVKYHLNVKEQCLFDGPWNKGLVEHTIGNFKIMISSPERAILEYMHFDSLATAVLNSLLIMANLTTLRPKVMQELLEACKSIKVKRLFLTLAKQLNHPWLKRLNVEKIALGTGKRVLGKGGYYNSTYQLSLPINLKKVLNING